MGGFAAQRTGKSLAKPRETVYRRGRRWQQDANPAPPSALIDAPSSTVAPPQRSPARTAVPARRTTAALAQTAWAPPRELELSEWIQQGRRLGALGRAGNWWLGDWVRYGNARYGERYETAARVTGYEVQSLMNMAYVASRYEISRRRETLSWSHHAEVAALAPDGQDVWLDRAQREGLSVQALRLERRLAEPPGPPEPGPPRSARASAPREVVCPNCGHGFHAEGRDSVSAASEAGSAAPDARA